MATTHKATPYKREPNIDNAHELGFYFTDNLLSWSLGLEIAEALGEALIEADDNADVSDVIHGVIDSVIPVYYSDILKEWQSAGCPDPDDRLACGPSIWDQMTAALWESMSDFANNLVEYAVSKTDALERVNAIYPYKND